jgi:hypothetical protein
MEASSSLRFVKDNESLPSSFEISFGIRKLMRRCNRLPHCGRDTVGNEKRRREARRDLNDVDSFMLLQRARSVSERGGLLESVFVVSEERKLLDEACSTCRFEGNDSFHMSVTYCKKCRTCLCKVQTEMEQSFLLFL